jgi:NAD(P)-dependent dehydrogenase (short-subunit alcohol dehydrogenase family)
MADVVLDSKPILERFSLKGRTALVTGAGQGIGRAFAHALAEAGASVAVADINTQVADQVVDELRAKSATAMAIVADVTKPAEAERMIAAVVSAWGKLTIAVNNAGMGSWVDSEAMTEQAWRSVLSLNLDAVFYCSQAEAKVMFKAGYGKIINTASMSGHIVNMPQNQSAYNTSKAGVLHLTRSLATEWATRGIRVNSISPGYTRTLLVENLLQTPVGQKVMPDWMARVPVARMAEVTDLQGAVVYLASEVSDYMTGSDLIIDGGYCAW